MEIADGVVRSDSQPAEPSVNVSLMFRQEMTDQALSNQFRPCVPMTYKVDADSVKQ